MKLSILVVIPPPHQKTRILLQVLEVKNHLFLIDCGEGTQIQLRHQKINFSRIKHILFRIYMAIIFLV